MKQLFFIISILTVGTFSANAQFSTIMVCSPDGNTCAPYDYLDSALTHAADGDYIYLPGGNFSITDPIDKEVHIIGAGYQPDSAQVTTISYINGDIRLDDSCNGSSFEGFKLQGDFVATCPLYYLTFRRVQCGNIRIANGNTTDPFSPAYTYGNVNNTLIDACVFSGNINLGTNSYKGTINVIRNSFLNYATYTTNSLLKNNILNHPAGFSGSLVYNSTINNNVVGYYGISGSGNVANNNIKIGGTYVVSGTGSVDNNTYNQTTAQTFQTATSLAFDFTKDYSIRATSPGHLGGTDGTDVGIYGGATPWKPGGIPSNPHFVQKSVSNAPDEDGQLQIQFKVRSEN